MAICFGQGTCSDAVLCVPQVAFIAGCLYTLVGFLRMGEWVGEHSQGSCWLARFSPTAPQPCPPPQAG